MHIAPIVRFWEARPGTVQLSYKASAVDRVRFKVLMQPDKRKLSCTATICKNMSYKTEYADKKCREKTRSFYPCTDQHWCDRFAHVHCISEDFLNTRFLIICQPVTIQLLVSVSLIDNSKRIHMYGSLIFYFETSP